RWHAAPANKRASSSADSMPADLNRVASPRRAASMAWPANEMLIRRPRLVLAEARLAGTTRPSRRRTLRGQLCGLVLRRQRVDQFAQRFARDHLRPLVERQVDAVIGDAALRKIVGADALG